MSTETTDTQSALGELVERLSLKTLVEACLVLEEGVAALKDIEIGMMAGAGVLPGPFVRADDQGLDDVLEALERAQSQWGDHFEPPRSHMVPSAIRKIEDARRNDLDEVEIWGDGTARREFMYVGDLVDFVAEGALGNPWQDA